MWTKDKPHKEGWYWFHNGLWLGACWIRELSKGWSNVNSPECPLVDDMDGWWEEIQPPSEFKE
jgi:hypothetical protein